MICPFKSSPGWIRTNAPTAVGVTADCSDPITLQIIFYLNVTFDQQTGHFLAFPAFYYPFGGFSFISGWELMLIDDLPWSVSPGISPGFCVVMGQALLRVTG